MHYVNKMATITVPKQYKNFGLIKDHSIPMKANITCKLISYLKS